MPDITPTSPTEFTQWSDTETHNRQHRAIEGALEALGAASGTGTFNTVTTLVAIANQFSQKTTPGTNSNAATIKGFYRTAAPIAVAVPAITMLGVTTVTNVFTFSIESQAGNAACVGDAVTLVPTTAVPTNVAIGDCWVSDTNSITVGVFGRTAASVTATFTVHVYFVDLT